MLRRAQWGFQSQFVSYAISKYTGISRKINKFFFFLNKNIENMLYNVPFSLFHATCIWNMSVWLGE